MLRVGIEIFEDIRRLVVRQQAKDDGLLFRWQFGYALGDIGRRPTFKDLAQRAEIRAAISSLISGRDRWPIIVALLRGRAALGKQKQRRAA